MNSQILLHISFFLLFSLILAACAHNAYHRVHIETVLFEKLIQQERIKALAKRTPISSLRFDNDR